MSAVVHSLAVDGPSRHDVRRAIDEVMARPEFAEPEASWFERLRDDALEALGDLLGGAFGALRDVLPTEGLLRTLVIGWMVVTLVAIVAHFVWTLAQLRRAPPATARDVADGDDEMAAIVTSAEALERARASAAAADFDDAMAALYRATILWLEEQGEVVVDESKTGGDYARSIADAPRRAGFRRMLRAYYPVAFGGRAATSDGWGAMADEARAVGVPVA